MEKAHCMKRNGDFQEIYKKGKSVANKQSVVYILKNECEHFRLGISTSKKIGDAVTRNRIKRAIRENFKVHKQDMISKDIIVMARQPARSVSTLEIQGSLEHVLKIAKVFNKRIKQVQTDGSLMLDKPKTDQWIIKQYIRDLIRSLLRYYIGILLN